MMRLQLDEHLLSMQSAAANAFGHTSGHAPRPRDNSRPVGPRCPGAVSYHHQEMRRKPQRLVACLVPPSLPSPAHWAEEPAQQQWAAAIGCRWCHLAYSPGTSSFPYAISLQQHGKYFIPYSKGCLIFYYFKAAHECFTEMISSGGMGKCKESFLKFEFWRLYSSHPAPMVAVTLVC